MSWIDEYDEPTLRGREYGDSGDQLWAAPDKSALRKTAEIAGFPKLSAWAAGEYAGRPESAPGPLYDILPEVGNYGTMIPGAVKGLANIPIQAYRRSQMAKAIPSMGEAFSQMGNPFTNTWKMLKGTMPQGGNLEPVGAMALDEGAQAATSLPSRARQLIGELKGSWGVDIPYNAKGTQYPWATIADDANPRLLPQIAEGLGVSGRVGEKTRGFYIPAQKEGSYLADVIAMKRGAIPGGTPIHETGHLAGKRVRGYGDLYSQPEELMTQARRAIAPEQAPQVLDDYMGAVTNNNSFTADYLRNMKAVNQQTGAIRYPYGKLSPERMGEELWTRNNAGQTIKGAPAFDDPAPFIGERMSSLTDELLHPYFKNYGQRELPNLPIGELGNFVDYDTR